MENRKILNNIHTFIQSQGEFSPEAENALSIFLYGYFKQVVVDLQARKEEDEHIELSEISSILRNLHFKNEFINDLDDYIEQFLATEKRKKISRLRDAGYGATSENVQFIKRVFESPHQTIDPSNHQGEFENDDE